MFLTIRRCYRRWENPVIIDAVREIRLHLDKTVLTQKKYDKESMQKGNLGFSISEAIGHLKSLKQDSNPNKAIVLNVRCLLAPEQYCTAY